MRTIKALFYLVVFIAVFALVPLAQSELIVQAEAINQKTVSLVWTDVHAKSYLVYRDGLPVAGVDKNISSYIDTGLVCGTSYLYYVQALMSTDGKDSKKSNLVSLSTFDCLTLTVEVVSHSSVNMIWTDVYAKSYWIYRDGYPVAATKTTSYTDTNLACGTSYSYYILALMSTDGKASQKSDKFLVETFSCPSVMDVPASPSNLSYEVTDSSIILYWDDNADNEDGFVLTHRWLRTDPTPQPGFFYLPQNANQFEYGLAKPGENYHFSLVAYNVAGESDQVSLSVSTVTSVEEQNLSKGFSLEQNYPNPFNPTTEISFNLPDAGLVSLKVFDILGREVANLIDGFQAAGNHKVKFNASNLSSGVYIYRLQSGNFVSNKKMILTK